MHNDSSVIGLRVPRNFFITSGVGESDITDHAGSMHLALREARIEQCNLMSYSSVLPSIANEISKNNVSLRHGSVMEVILACSTTKLETEKIATAALIWGWLYDRKSNEKYGGFVCEYNGSDNETVAIENLHKSLKELYTNGYEELYELKDIKFISRSITPTKKYATALCAMCFVDYEIPLLNN